jgi:all-trans-retinol 13,14-reductase
MGTPSWDAIVIGSGIGGMSCASLLAQLGGKRVLVLEKHFKPGGFTHEFKRGRFRWDVGLHYVGGMGEGQPSRRIMDLVTGAAVQWTPMCDPFERFCYPGFRFDVPFGEANYRAALTARFAGQTKAIEHYFRDVERAAAWMGLQIARKAMPRWLDMVVDLVTPDREVLALQTTGAYLAKHITDPLLRAVLASQWGDYGLPPGESAFGLHALVVASYFDGAYGPVGGAHAIADGVMGVLAKHGGELRVAHEVERIVIEHGKAVGVRVRHRGESQELRAPLVISDAGADVTYLKLVPPEQELWFRDEILAFPHGRSGVLMFLGLRADPRRLGIAGENHWLFAGTDHDALARDNVGLFEGHPTAAFVSFATTHDPVAAAHTAQIITEIDGEAFSAWHDSQWKHRGESYEALKQRVGDGLLAFVEQHIPGLRALVETSELATPLSVEQFTSKRYGAFYGLPGIPAKFHQRWLDVHTPIDGLLLTGSDVGTLGITGALMGGAITAGSILGARALGRIMSGTGGH